MTAKITSSDLDRSTPDPACRACGTAADCDKHLRFTCASCGTLTHWNDGAADDRPNDCSNCWAVWFDAMQAVATGLFSALGGAP